MENLEQVARGKRRRRHFLWKIIQNRTVEDKKEE
jgi:hypothetical protein